MELWYILIALLIMMKISVNYYFLRTNKQQMGRLVEKQTKQPKQFYDEDGRMLGGVK